MRKQLKIVGLGLLLMLSPGFVLASVLSELAADLAPGDFVELEIDGDVSTCQAMVQPLPTLTPTLVQENPPRYEPYPPSRVHYYGNILEFTDEALWDPVGREVYIMGTRRPYQRWDQGFVKYTEATNSWTILDLPPFGVGAHGYDNGAIDVSRGHYYWSRISAARIVWRMDLSTGVWEQLANAPINAGQFSALEFFPELDRLVFFDGLGTSEYALYNPDPEIESWEGPFSLNDTPFGSISHFSEYNQDRGVMFFGGGFHYSAGGTIPDPTPNINELRRFYMLDSNKVVTRLADPPTFLGQTGAGPIQTIDPNTGNLVVFQGKPNDRVCPQNNEKLPIWEFNLDTNTWQQTGEQRLSSRYCAMDSVAVPLYEHGVIFIASVRSDTDCRVHLYRHSPGTPSAPSILTEPDDATVPEGADATFRVVTSGSGPLSYQWSRTDSTGTAAILDATSASVTVTDVNASDSGGRYFVEVSNDLGIDRSADAVLTVTSDTTAPTLVSAVAANNTRVDLRFSEPVSVSSAENSGNYQVDRGVTVSAANLSDDGLTVSLTLSELTTDTSYTVSVSNIQDRAQTPNTIVNMSRSPFTYRDFDGFEDGNADGWAPLTASRWEVVLEGGNYVYWLNTTVFDSLPVQRLGEYSLLAASYDDFTFTMKAKLGDNISNGLADYAVIFGYQDSNNYYYVMFNNKQSATQLAKVIDGRRTELVTADSDWLKDNNYHNIEVSRAGNEIKVYFDNSLVFSDDDDSLGAGRVGVGSYNDSAYFDDVGVVGAAIPNNTSPVTSPTGLSIQRLQ